MFTESPSRRILLVDDTPIVREPMARLLWHEGYMVYCAANGIEAMQIATRDVPDLIILDLMMPKMNGCEFLEALRADARLKELPVMVFTGAMDPASLNRVRELGAVEVIAKAQFTADELLARVREYAGNA